MRVDRPSRRSRLCLAIAALLACGTSALAAPADTVWLAPVDGNFADPARWSNGAPNSTSAAIFGASDSTDGFSVTFATSPSIAMLRVLSQSPLFALGGHSLALLAAEGLTIAGPESLAPTLTLSNGTLTTPKTTIGATGATGAGGGTLRVRDGAHFVSSNTTFGVTAPDLGLLDVKGPGTTASIGPLPTAGVRLSIGDGAMVNVSTVPPGSIGIASALHFEYGEHGVGMLLVNGGLQLHGSLSLTIDSGVAIPPGSILLLAQAAVVTGEFDSIDVPLVNGVPLTIVVTSGYLFAVAADANTQLVVAPRHVDLFKGYTSQLTATLAFTGGQLVSATDDVDWNTAVPSIATVLADGRALGMGVGETTASAGYGSLASNPTTISVVAVPPDLQFLRASEAADGTGGNDDACTNTFIYPEDSIGMTPDGRYVVFDSKASNLVEGDDGGHRDIFRKDLATGEVVRVSVALDGTSPNNVSLHPVVSADGRFVAFQSYASNLVLGDDGFLDVFVRDMLLGTTERLRAVPPAGTTYYWAVTPKISADGRYVAFVQRDSSGKDRVYRFDRQSGTADLVSATSTGAPASAVYFDPIDISADGSIVVFDSLDQLVPGQPSSTKQVWIRDFSTGQLIAVSRALDGTFGNSDSDRASVTADGRFVVFRSWASNLATPSAPINSILVWDRVTGGFELANISSAGVPANDQAWRPSISPDGRFVTFDSSASNLVEIPISWAGQLFRHDRLTHAMELVSIGPVGIGAGSTQTPSVLADDGRIAFATKAENLAPFDLNQHIDVVVRAMPPSVFADLDGDGIVNAADLAILIAAWGSNSYFPDLDKDGVVGAADLGALLGAWSVR
ncbi:MAG: hypothetical protein U0572_03640 [Phycisphaerales bacterium]